MVACQIDEGSGPHPDPVQPELVEPVAGGFHRQKADPGAGKLRQNTVQLHRVRGRKPLAARQVRGNHAKGAHAGGLAAQPGPDLTGEIGDGGLAVGAGHGDHGFRLLAEEARRHAGQAQPRVGVGYYGNRTVQRNAGGGQHGARAAPDGVGDEAAAIGPGPGQGGEQKAGADLTGIRRQPFNINVEAGGDGRVGWLVAIHEVNKTQGACSRSERGRGARYRPPDHGGFLACFRQLGEFRTSAPCGRRCG